MSRFIVHETSLPPIRCIERKPLSDTRGFLARLFCAEELRAVGWRGPVAQINHTCTVKQGSVRGFHFQHPPSAEMKLVTCIRGAVWDVAVDIRAGSPTFLKWHAETLSAENGRALLIPEGFAHGFQTISDNAELLYCHSAAHNPAAEDGINPEDPMLAIPWPLAVGEISARDSGRAFLSPSFAGVAL